MTEPVHIAPEPRGRGLAIASMVCGILGMFCLPLIGSITALILGIIVLAKKKAGQGMAIAGVVLGGVGLLFLPILAGLLLPAIAAARDAAEATRCAQNMKQIAVATMAYRADHGQPPSDLQTLVQAGLLDPKFLDCRSSKDGTEDYVLIPVDPDKVPDPGAVLMIYDKDSKAHKRKVPCGMADGSVQMLSSQEATALIQTATDGAK